MGNGVGEERRAVPAVVTADLSKGPFATTVALIKDSAKRASLELQGSSENVATCSSAVFVFAMKRAGRKHTVAAVQPSVVCFSTSSLAVEE